MTDRSSYTGVSMSFVDLFACALGGVSFLLFYSFGQAPQVSHEKPSDVQIVSDSIPPLHANTEVKLALSARGGMEPYRWEMSSAVRDQLLCEESKATPGLPPGLTFDPDTGVLQGTPTIQDSPSLDRDAIPQRHCVEVAVEAQGVSSEPAPNGPDDAGRPRSAATRTFVVEIWPPIQAQPTLVKAKELRTAYVGTKYVYQFERASMVEGTHWQVVEAIFTPERSGLAMKTNVQMKDGMLSWDPTTRGRLDIKLAVGDRFYSSTSQGTVNHFWLKVEDKPVGYEPPEIATDQLPTAIEDVEYRVRLAVRHGEPPFRWSPERLPEGLSLDPETGVIGGTIASKPNAAARVPDHSFKVSVTDNRGKTNNKDFRLNILPGGNRPLELRIVTEQAHLDSQPFVFGRKNQEIHFSAIGGKGQKRWEIRLKGDDLGLRAEGNVIKGTPSRTGTIDALVTVQDEDDKTKPLTDLFKIRVVAPELRIVTALDGEVRAGERFRITASAIGGVPPYHCEVQLPSGANWLRSHDGQGLCTLEGTPVAPGRVNVVITAADDLKHETRTELPILVPEGLQVKAPDLFVLYSGQQLKETLWAAGGHGRISWELVPLSNGTWLTLNQDGELSGKADTVGQSKVKVVAKDEAGQTSEKAVDVRIVPGEVRASRVYTAFLERVRGSQDLEMYFRGFARCQTSGNSCALPDATVGVFYETGLMAGAATIISGHLPDGIDYGNQRDGYWGLSGVPKAQGDHSFTMRIHDGDGQVIVPSVKLTIKALSPLDRLREAITSYFVSWGILQ